MAVPKFIYVVSGQQHWMFALSNWRLIVERAVMTGQPAEIKDKWKLKHPVKPGWGRTIINITAWTSDDYVKVLNDMNKGYKIDPDHLFRVRSVYDGAILKTGRSREILEGYRDDSSPAGYGKIVVEPIPGREADCPKPIFLKNEPIFD
jgi:hypothetical protein